MRKSAASSGCGWISPKPILTVGDSKTEAGEGRTIPLNSALLEAMVEYSKWYSKRFGTIQSEWYQFPFGRPRPCDPTRPMVTLKTSWNNARKKAKVEGRWHDNRHTLITDLAESGAGDETIRDIAGHVSKQMLKHYSHIRTEAKRRALQAIVPKLGDKATGTAVSADSEPAAQFKSRGSAGTQTRWSIDPPVLVSRRPEVVGAGLR